MISFSFTLALFFSPSAKMGNRTVTNIRNELDELGAPASLRGFQSVPYREERKTLKIPTRSIPLARTLAHFLLFCQLIDFRQYQGSRKLFRRSSKKSCASSHQTRIMAESPSILEAFLAPFQSLPVPLFGSPKNLDTAGKSYYFPSSSKPPMREKKNRNEK